MILADIPVTPAQVYAGLGVLIVLGGGLLLFRKVFDFASKEDLNRLETTIRLELERHSTARHEMRHEMTKVVVAIAKLETMLEQLPGKLRQK